MEYSGFSFREFTPGERQKLLGICLKGLVDEDLEIFRRAAYCLRFFKQETELLEEVLMLLDSVTAERELLLIEAIGELECEGGVSTLENRFLSLGGGEFPDIRERGMSILLALSKIHSPRSIEFATRILFPSEGDASWDTSFLEIGIELLLNIALNGYVEALEVIKTCRMHPVKEIRELSREALAELNEQEWENKGFATIHAKLPRTDP